MNKHVPKRWTRLTKRDALLLCIELWKWLQANPAQRKLGWPRHEDNGGDVPAHTAFCPCCAYVEQHDRECCIIPEWSEGVNPAGCQAGDSPFCLWWHAQDNAERSKQARRIVKMAQKALAALPKARGET